ncbi:hypothetical protein B0H11DRAFT_2433833 [Mycena galericulata]|nr:hypothetical protein B0H11DRAFT_2433833 [Mycena galericulata]
MMFYKKKTSAPSSSDSPSISHPGLRPLRLVEKLVAADIIQPFSVPKTPPTLDIKKQARSTANAPKSLSASSRHSIGPIKPRASSAGQTTVVSKRAPFVVPLNYSAPRVPRTTPTTVTRPARSSGEGLAARRRAANNVSRPRAKLPVSLLATPAKPAPATLVADKSSSKSVVDEKSASKSAFQSRIPVFVRRGSFSKVFFTPSSTPRISSSRIPRLRYMGGSPATSRFSTSNCSVTSTISSNAHTPCPSLILVVETRPLAPWVVSKVEAAADTTSAPAIGAPQDPPSLVDVAKIMEDATLAMEVARPIGPDCLVNLVEAGSLEMSDVAATESTRPSPSRKTPVRDQSHSSKSTIFRALFAELKAGHPELRDVTATESSRLPLGDSKPLSHPDRSHGPQSTLFSALFSELKAGHPALRDVTATKSTRPLSARLVDPKPDRSDGSQSNILGALFAELKTKLSGTTGAKRPASGMRPFILSATSGNLRDKENVQVESELQKVFARRRSSAFGLPFNSESQASDKSEARVQERRPLVPVPRAANHSRPSPSIPAGTPPPPPPPPPASSPARSPSSPPTDADSTPPGAVYITELVNTAFGTRKVRRSIIPPMEEGAQPSRDPRIVMELDRLRAQQKVGGGAGAVLEEAVGR